MHGFALLLDGLYRLALTLSSSEYWVVGVFVLAAVFIMSGVPKMRRPELAAIAMVDLSMASRPFPRIAYVVGVFECLLGAGLAFASHQQLVLVAAVLLWFFAILLILRLRSQPEFPCFCFGESDDKLNVWSVLRTTALACLATALAIARPPDSAYEATTPVLQGITALALLSTALLIGSTRKTLRASSPALRVGA